MRNEQNLDREEFNCLCCSRNKKNVHFIIIKSKCDTNCQTEAIFFLQRISALAPGCNGFAPEFFQIIVAQTPAFPSQI